MGCVWKIRNLGFASSSPVCFSGGPFVPADEFYTLRNTGSEPLEWAAECDALWISLSPSSGIIQPDGHVTVRASLADIAATLSAGRHSAVLNFVNRTNGLGNTEAGASVLVGAFVMDGAPDAPGYTVTETGLGLHVAVRGTRLYVATTAPAGTGAANDHHLTNPEQYKADGRGWPHRRQIAGDPGGYHSYLKSGTGTIFTESVSVSPTANRYHLIGPSRQAGGLASKSKSVSSPWATLILPLFPPTFLPA